MRLLNQEKKAEIFLHKKKLSIYLDIISNLLMIIRNKDSKIRSLEIQLREVERLKGIEGNNFH